MSDSEEDYMSDAFLAKCQDTRPGLTSARTSREHQKQVKTKELNERHKTKPRKVIEAEKRDEGLSKAIGQDNKGFALMQKMGYKSGMKLGKDGSGRAEPVPINVRAGREGLGGDTERKRKREEMAVMRTAMIQKRKKQEETYQQDYRAHRSKQMAERQNISDLYKSQRVCEQLDEEQGYDEPVEVYFWTPVKMELIQKKKNPEEDNEDSSEEYRFTAKQDDDHDDEDSYLGDGADTAADLSVEDTLEMLTEYLRETYCYCVWCGARYEDTEDMTKNCPGNTSDAHDS